MKKVIVVGAGLAGLSASVYLSDNDFQVTLIEASPKAGGRAYSLSHNSNGYFFDNGQHILMGCYEETIAFFKKINSLEKLDFQKSLRIPFVLPNGTIHKFESPKNLYPLNLLMGIMKYKALTLKERLKIIDFFLDLICCASCDLKDKSVSQWLRCKNQSENSVKAFWEILVVGALNTTIDKASAEIFSEILKIIFLTGNKSASILVPRVGLTELYVDDALNFILKKNGRIFLSERVTGLEMTGETVSTLVTNKNSYADFDAVVFAIPAYSLGRILNRTSQPIAVPEFQYSPIVNAHFWLKNNPFEEKFYSLIDSEIHWLFNHGSHITLTTSAADDIILLDESEIKRLFSSELEKYFPIFNREIIVDSKVIKEKRATFVPDITSNEARKGIYCSIKNVIIAGDWTDTGLPSTIESAVLSGRLAAGNVINSLK